MKYVKLLLSMSLLILSGNLRAQAIFANKSKFMTMSDAPAFTQVNFLHYISEKVNLDSLKNDTAFYTVNFFESDSNYSDQYHLKCYSNKVYFSGKIIDYNLEFFYSIGEDNGVYIEGEMMKCDDKFLEFVNKLKVYYEKFKSKWSKVMGSRKKTIKTEE